MDKKTSIKSRHTGIELLRILSIVGIVSMHAFGNFLEDAKGFEIVWGVFICSLFNCGVSIFAFISGFFGVKTNARKVIQFEIDVLFWSVLSLIIICVFQKNINTYNIISSFTPIFSRKYWYITEYMILLIISPFLHQLVNTLNKQQFKKLIFILIFIGYIIPTLIQRDLSGYDGKCFLNILSMYLIGRYINLYVDIEKIHLNSLLLYFSVVLIITFVLNISATLIGNILGDTGVHNPFGKDNSFFILLMSISIFCVFYKIKIVLPKVNNVANYVISVYLFEGAAGIIIKTYILNPASNRDMGIIFYISLIFYPLLVCIFCILIGYLKGVFLFKIQKRITDFLFYMYNIFFESLSKQYKIRLFERKQL